MLKKPVTTSSRAAPRRTCTRHMATSLLAGSSAREVISQSPGGATNVSFGGRPLSVICGGAGIFTGQREPERVPDLHMGTLGRRDGVQGGELLILGEAGRAFGAIGAVASSRLGAQPLRPQFLHGPAEFGHHALGLAGQKRSQQVVLGGLNFGE